MKIAVTAANSQLGRAVVKSILDGNPQADVAGLVRTPSKAADLCVDIRPGDYDDRTQLETSLQGVDCVLLISGLASPEQRIIQHRNVIAAAQSAGVQKLVYTSIFGKESDYGFSPIVTCNRQTEQDLRESGLDWAVGRNGLYIEPDLEYIENYKQEDRIANCAGDGRCAYTTRGELAYAYSKLLLEEGHEGRTYTLAGEPITQSQLTEFMNQAFGTELVYEPMSVADYLEERQAELGDFMGSIIGGIYEGIRLGVMDVPSDYAAAAGREHISWTDFFGGLEG